MKLYTNLTLLFFNQPSVSTLAFTYENHSLPVFNINTEPVHTCPFIKSCHHSPSCFVICPCNSTVGIPTFPYPGHNLNFLALCNRFLRCGTIYIVFLLIINIDSLKTNIFDNSRRDK